MNTDPNNHPGAAASNHHAAAPPDQTVDPKLLFPFLNPFRLSYVEWMDDLRRGVAGAEVFGQWENTNYRGIVSVEGKDALTRRLVHGLALPNYRLPAILLRTAIQESFDDPYPSIDWFLDHYRTLVVDGRATSAHALHEFLQVDEEIYPWIKRHIKALKMRFRRDYCYAFVGVARPVMKQTVITIPMAEKIVMATGTPRALQVQKLLAEAEARRKALKEAGY